MAIFNRISFVSIFCLALLFGVHAKKTNAADFPVLGSTIEQPPFQLLLVAPEEFPFQGKTLTKLASYTITGRVLSLSRYHADHEATVSPFDLALAWGWLSKNEILNQLEFNEHGRHLYYQRKIPSAFTIEQIAGSSSNNHIIPANEDIADAINSLRKDEIVTLRGTLVNVKDFEGWHWNTSLSRDDLGDGACEIIYVTEVIVYRDIAYLLKTAPYSQKTSLN